MKTDQTTIPDSMADFWINNTKTGVWRTARQQNVCCAKGARHTIEPGQRHLDSGERDHGSHSYKDAFSVCNIHHNGREVQLCSIKN